MKISCPAAEHINETPVITYTVIVAFIILLLFSDQDEVHERDRFSDFLLIALRDLLTVNRRLKLILMSAALDINLFIEYFGKCPVVHGKSFFWLLWTQTCVWTIYCQLHLQWNPTLGPAH